MKKKTETKIHVQKNILWKPGNELVNEIKRNWMHVVKNVHIPAWITHGLHLTSTPHVHYKIQLTFWKSKIKKNS